MGGGSVGKCWLRKICSVFSLLFISVRVGASLAAPPPGQPMALGRTGQKFSLPPTWRGSPRHGLAPTLTYETV